MKLLIKSIIAAWIPLAIAILCTFGLVYVAVQQSYRQSANDPQIQLAEDAAIALRAGADPQTVIPDTTVNFAESLDPYIVIFNESGTPVAGNGVMESGFPALPAGVFDFTRRNSEDRFTWQPSPGVRSAVVLVHINTPQGGFALAGRSLREVEIRETNLELITGAAALFTLILTLALAILGGWWWHPGKSA